MSKVIGLKDIINQVVEQWSGNLYGTKTQSAKALNVSVTTIDNYRSMGLVESVKRGNKVYFSSEVIAKVIRDGIDATGMSNHVKKNYEVA
ncbi:hypothetical protein SAMN06313540_10219 [Epsilonproteobacteria bacterium SCGC AD-308-E02]|jgi:hypothetical protein|nr:hypothetical protein SAMN06313540_10219 [Epsilonproteobacteria bacterium SCGC AD-308-E02]